MHPGQRPRPLQVLVQHLLRGVALGLTVWQPGLPALAAPGAHVHGLVQLDVAVDGQTLRLQVEAPLHSLLGFEHRPRNAAQRQAADAVIQRMGDGAALFRPDAAAQCSLAKTEVHTEALQPAKAGAAQDDGHADLDATYEFICRAPDRLAVIELGLFNAFGRIQRIAVQVAGAKGQFRQTLQRPQDKLKLTR